MRSMLILLAAVPFLAIANETIESDGEWAEEYMRQFKNEVLLEYVYKILVHSRDEVEFYNNCTEEFEYPMQVCEKGYNLVTTIKLPGNDPSLGKGDLQMYFAFGKDQQLINVAHELYYPAHH